MFACAFLCDMFACSSCSRWNVVWIRVFSLQSYACLSIPCQLQLNPLPRSLIMLKETDFLWQRICFIFNELISHRTSRNSLDSIENKRILFNYSLHVGASQAIQVFFHSNHSTEKNSATMRRRVELIWFACNIEIAFTCHIFLLCPGVPAHFPKKSGNLGTKCGKSMNLGFDKSGPAFFYF